MTAAASGDGPLSAHVRLIRAAADLIEQAGIPGLALYTEQDEIVTQFPAAAVGHVMISAGAAGAAMGQAAFS
jgi:hypothetical protein